MSNSFKIRPTHFPVGALPPLVTGLWTSIHHKKQKFLRTLSAFSILV